MEKLKKFFDENDFFAKHCGIRLLEVKTGFASAEMNIKDYHMNGAKVVHGGAIFTLADYTFAAASNSHGNFALAINASISFLKAKNTGKLTAVARENNLNAKLGTYTIEVTDENGALISIFQGTVYRKKESIPV